MPPVDSTPNLDTDNFKLLYSLKAYEKIPVFEYVSKQTGLTVVIAEVDGPVVNGYFCLVTEAFDDDGLPHTLEHLIFLGSEEYPYKGVLDLLANRCLASGTNAWTDVDHTCYTMETAGSEGFLALMPIYLEHILYPILKDEAFITEVHHITGTGEDAGVVYCEMQGRENSAESRLHLAVARNIYPGKCGYSSETGGIMKNLRESTTNEKVRKYHKEFYRPENLKIIITGQVKIEDVLKALEPLEQKILEKGPRGPFQRPWQNPVPSLTEESKELVIKYPADEESNGPFAVAWRGPSCVKDLYNVTACSLLLKYLTEYSVSPLPKEFVEIEDPFASKITYNLYENAETCLYITFEDVPLDKLSKVLPKLQEILKNILEKEDIDMKKLESIIKRYKLESLSNIENSPHHAIAFMIIGHMLYGNSKEDLEERVNPLQDLNRLLKEPKSFWLNLLKTYFVENKYVAIQCVPSKEEQTKMAKEEKERIDTQIEKLGESGLRAKEQSLQKAIEQNDREPPLKMLTSVQVPTVNSINFHNIVRYKTDSPEKNEINLSETPVFTYFDHLKTNFVYIFALLDTGSVPSELRIYLPLLLESLLELPIEKNGKLIPYEEVVAQLNDDTVSTATAIGLSICGNRLFTCGRYSQNVTVSLQVEAAKYETGLNWLKDLLYNTKFTAERLKVVAMKMNNALAQAKRSGRNVVSYVMKSMCYSEDSNVYNNGMLVQSKFLTSMIEQLDNENSQQILERFEKVRSIITDPQNYNLHIAGNLNILKNPENAILEILPPGVKKVSAVQPLKSTPDYKLLKPLCDAFVKNCIISMGCLESSFFLQTVKSISSYDDPDLPALMLYMQYLIQTEGPMWKSIRGKGYAYNYSMWVKVSEGLLYLVYGRATNVVGAYKETKAIVQKQLETKEWDDTSLEAAKSSLIFTIIDEEKTIGSVVALSVASYFQGVDYSYNRTLLSAVNNVSKEDLNRVGELYIAPLFDPNKVRTAVVTDPSKAADIAEGFKNAMNGITDNKVNGKVPNNNNRDVESGVPPGDSVIGEESFPDTGKNGKKSKINITCNQPTTHRINRRSTKTRPVRVLIRRVIVMLLVLSILVGLGAVIYYFFGYLFLIQLILVAVVAYIAAGHYRWLYIAAKTAPRDLCALIKYVKLLIEVKTYARKNLSISDIFKENVKKHPNKPALLFEDQTWTFKQVDEYSNKVANLFKSHGYKKGDKVALFLENKPEFVCIWLGLSKLGVITPLINTNLRLSSLVHSITIAKSQAVIFGSELSDAVMEILDKIESKVALYQISCNNNVVASSTDQRFENMDLLLKDAPTTPPNLTEKLGHHDHVIYIYTSGTTGLPKAAVITTSRFIFIAGAMHHLCGFRASDRFYTPLPLYHTAGGCMTVGQMLMYGSSVVIRKKFSASAYFPDCRKYNCTVAQYIGEMCRYILAVPPSNSDTDHNLRMIYGNGLRPQIWTEFIDRFNIKKVCEFYGATEGNANIVNVDNTVGSIGFISRIIPSVYPISIIKVDPNTGEPVRNARGLCMTCQPNEPGVFIGKIIPNNPSRAFLGYVDEAASKKKIVQDVFEKGDSAFLSGDILVADELGNLFFKDRTGDTFRWKGENVSTSEVEAVMSNLVNYKDVVVYGVEIRGQEGRAGMAAIYDPENTVDLKELVEGVKKCLPSYARPILIRILTKLDLTGTYKLKKNDLQAEDFNPSKISDSLYYMNLNTNTYEPVTKEIYDKICSGAIRV